MAELLDAMHLEAIAYCHWKSNWRLDEWLTGKGDLDLLVAREDAPRFESLIYGLGFKRTTVSGGKELPGVVNYYGYRRGCDRLVHIHAHYSLVAGHDASKNYRFPIESKILARVEYDERGIYRISREEELLLFVIRMVLKLSFADGIKRLIKRTSKQHHEAIRKEIEVLQSGIDTDRFDAVLDDLFPGMGQTLFKECLDVLMNKRSAVQCFAAKQRLESYLKPMARHSRLYDHWRRITVISEAAMQAAGLKARTRKRFSNGGAFVAFVGGDGSGKSSCVDAVSSWLGAKFDVRQIHMGRPPRSPLTYAAAGAAKGWRTLFRGDGAGNILEQFRSLCIARDRYRLYRRMRKFASNGGLVISDRFPLPVIKLMDAPRIKAQPEGAFSTIAARMARREAEYYRAMLPPDLLIVLRISPVLAVRRKPTEPASHVHSRSSELWNIAWGDDVTVVDANRKFASVLETTRSLIWNRL